MRIICKSLPNNEYRCTLISERAPRPLPSSEELGCSNPSLDMPSGERPSPLTSVPNSKPGRDKLAPGWGVMGRRTVFGRYATSRLLAAGGAIDKLEFRPEQSVFLTGTLPGSTELAKKAIAEWSGYIVHALKAWIAKRVQNKLDFYVWEMQKRGALHLHYVVVIESKSVRDQVLSDFKHEWIRILDNVSRKAGCDLYERASGGTWASNKSVVQAIATEVHSSVAAYLSGYVANGRSKHANDKNQKYYPSRWWGVSRPLNSVITRMTSVKEFFTVGYRGAIRLFNELVEKLSRFGLRASEFAHKVGIGRTAVIYVQSEDWQNIWNSTMHNSTLDSETTLNGYRNLILLLLSEYSKLQNRLRRSSVRSKSVNLERSEELILSLGTFALNSDKRLCRAVEELGALLPLQSIGRYQTEESAEMLRLMVKSYWQLRRLVVFGPTGFISNVSFCNQALDKTVLQEYYRTMSQGRDNDVKGALVQPQNSLTLAEQLELLL